MQELEKTGLFLVIDGNDGSGKATQVNLLAAALEERGIGVLKIDFPRYHTNIMGRLIGESLSGKHSEFATLDPHITSVLYAADRFESRAEIEAALKEDKVVIADRYASSNQIHQGGKIEDKEERKMFLRWLEELEHGLFGIPRPDRIVYLKVPVEASLKLLEEKRSVKNTNLSEGEKDQVEQDRNYLEQSHDTALWLSEHQANWTVIDCLDEEGSLRTRESVHDEILGIVDTFLDAQKGASEIL